MTSSKCLTGTDRVYEVSKKVLAENYINVQGDEPIFNPMDLKKIIRFILKKKKIINLCYWDIQISIQKRLCKIQIFRKLFLIKIMN